MPYKHCSGGHSTARLAGQLVQDILQIVSSPMLIWTCSLNVTVKWNLTARSSAPRKGMSQEDKRALTIMEESAEIRDGHYQIAIPCKVFPPYLRNNKAVAQHRLSLLKKRLKRDPELHQKYALFVDDLFETGHARKVPDYQRDSPAWYLPHHSVIHPQGKPGKVRVVFDCAAKFQNVSPPTG